jgi:hypothetical protein
MLYEICLSMLYIHVCKYIVYVHIKLLPLQIYELANKELGEVKMEISTFS